MGEAREAWRERERVGVRRKRKRERALERERKRGRERGLESGRKRQERERDFPFAIHPQIVIGLRQGTPVPESRILLQVSH